MMAFLHGGFAARERAQNVLEFVTREHLEIEDAVIVIASESGGDLCPVWWF